MVEEERQRMARASPQLAAKIWGRGWGGELEGGGGGRG